MESTTLWSGLLGGVFGGLLAGGFAVFATWMAHQHALRRLDLEEKALVKSLLQSLHDELETLWARYHRGIGVQLEALQDGQPCLWYYLANQDYVHRIQRKLTSPRKD